jgi:hypothetical protein
MQITAVNAKASVGSNSQQQQKIDEKQKKQKVPSTIFPQRNTTLGLFFCGSVVLKNTDFVLFCMFWPFGIWLPDQKMVVRVHLFATFLFGEKDGVDVGQDTTGGDGGGREQFVQFFVVADRQLDVTGGDARTFVVTGGVTGQFEDFGAQVFEDGGHVDGGTTTDTFGVATFFQVTGDTSDWELQTSFGRAGSALSFLFTTSSFSFSWHIYELI